MYIYVYICIYIYIYMKVQCYKLIDIKKIKKLCNSRTKRCNLTKRICSV